MDDGSLSEIGSCRPINLSAFTLVSAGFSGSPPAPPRRGPSFLPDLRPRRIYIVQIKKVFDTDLNMLYGSPCSTNIGKPDEPSYRS